MTAELAELYYQEGSSDKIYNLSLEQKGSNWSVHFEYGRRGSSLNTGTKVANTTYDKAKKVYDKLLSEKRGKGYKVVGGSMNFRHINISDPNDTGWKPQLLNEIAEEDLQTYLNNPEFCLQTKYDGRNRLLLNRTGGPVGANRKGLEVALPQNILDDIKKLPIGTVLAGEDLGSRVVVFDVISEGKMGYKRRYAKLSKLIKKSMTSLTLADTAWTKDEKLVKYQNLKKNNEEGVVFKHIDAHYTPGRPASGGSQLKFKFCSTASVIAGDQNEGKRSVEMYVWNGIEKVNVGNVTVYPNQSIPKKGTILEIKYLYAYKDGSLYQPVLLGVRDDISNKDCIIGQLKYKKEE